MENPLTLEERLSVSGLIAHDFNNQLATLGSIAIVAASGGTKAIEEAAQEGERVRHLLYHLGMVSHALTRLQDDGKDYYVRQESQSRFEYMVEVLKTINDKAASRLESDISVPEPVESLMPLIYISIYNLVKNALRADRKSTVTLTIEPYSGEVVGNGFTWGVSQGDFLKVSVHDTGPGFPTDRPIVEFFDKGVSASGSAGFGLHLVKLTCKYLGAPLTAHSEQGNTFVNMHIPG